MQNNRLGCLTGSGIFSSFVTLIVLVGVALTNGGQMFSAGALNAQAGEPLGGVASHAEIKECSACHVSPWSNETMNVRCLKCHQTIAPQIFDPNSLHFIAMNGDANKACRTCHPEHRGASASLTQFEAGEFPHERFGFSLNGHQQNQLGQPVLCADCHREGYSFSVAVCGECHGQMDAAFMTAHQNQFGAECLACHDGADRYGASFNHAAFFALEGKHAAAECSACHGNARAAADFQAASSDCYSCHQKDDEHQGQFGTACGVCHSPEGWEPAKFDHNFAAFKLEGEHTEVACEECHINDVFKGTPQDCYSCHQKDDEHQGQFGTACETCHNPTSWENATFDHNLAAFKLEGAHANVACEKCHLNGVFKGTPQDCYSCHQKDDEHQGQFGTACETCHNPTSWENATFDHNLAAFKLDGAHANVACEKCHLNGVFKGTPQDCYSCHQKDDEHKGQNGTDCAACHKTTSWDDVTEFDHASVNFPLIGGHSGVACAQCHQGGAFQGLSVRCATCHADPQFHAGAFGADCESCHTLMGWSPAQFNISHPEPNTDEGGSGIHHGGATCRQCHPVTTSQATCDACHKNGFEGEGEGEGGDDD